MSNLLKSSKLSPSDVNYDPIALDSGSHEFSLDIGHQVDYACFALWDGAREKELEIIEDIRERFELIGNFEISWSEVHYNRNIARLYQTNGGLEEFNGWNRKVGPTPFRFLVVRDRLPKYTWRKSVSGNIEPSNENVVDAKLRYRNYFHKKYQVHSSANLSEFLNHATLVLGPGRLEHVLNTENCVEEILHKDLEGAEKWDSWQHLFAVLNQSVKYLVLRNYEGLPDYLKDTDIDFLCDDFQEFASTANVIQQTNDRPYKGEIHVGDATISVDIRFIGDGYYPAGWQVDMLRRRKLYNSFYITAPDDLFFSLLYHCKVQKRTVNVKYGPELARIANNLRLNWFDPRCLKDDHECGKILWGYMKAQGYRYEHPIDKGVYENTNVIKFLPQLDNISLKRSSLTNKMRMAFKNPEKILPYILRKLGNRVN